MGEVADFDLCGTYGKQQTGELNVVAIAIFSDTGDLFLMGKTRESAIECAQKATTKRTYRYIEDEAQRLQYLSRALGLMNGTEGEPNGKSKKHNAAI